jgi:hypothetical protein
MEPTSNALSELSPDLHNTVVISGEKMGKLLMTICIIEPLAGQLVIISALSLQMSH